MALAHWIEHGYPPFDLSDVDIRRTQPFEINKTYLYNRVKETLGLLYADHFPYRQVETARGIRRSPLHQHLKNNGAVFGQVAGWERPNWFAKDNQKPEYQYSWKRQNWFQNAQEEHNAIRNNVGLYDMSSFGKIRVEGKDATKFLNYICGNEVDVPVNKIVYTQFLNNRAGIEADVTITKLTTNTFLVVTPAATLQREISWMNKHKQKYNVTITDVTAAEAVIAVMGPNSRNLLQKISPHDWSNQNHPFGTAQEIEIGMGIARAHRVSYVGELGWEIYVSTDMAEHIFETILDEGKNHNLKLVGMHTMDSLRIEKAFRHFGHDITEEDNVIEAGLGFAVQTSKKDFVGKEAVVKTKEEGTKRRMMQFKLNDPEPMLYHNEPIIRDNQIVSYLTSGNYGHTLGGAIGMGYVPCNSKDDKLLESEYQIEVAGKKIGATASLKPMYDPKAERTKL